MSTGPLLRPEDMQALMRVSLGQEPADLVIEGGDVVSVYSGELLKNCSVAVKDRWIASMGPHVGRCIGPETERIDAKGRVLIPGLIDGHTHLLYYCTPDEFLRYGMRGGTTTIITELATATFSYGYEGLIEILEGFGKQPIKIFATVSPSITLNGQCRQRAPNLKQLLDLLNREDVVGVGEGFWYDVLKKDTHFPTLAEEALRLRKSVEGHAAGCRQEKLQAYLDFGVSSCHESVNTEEALEKLRMGICVMIRHGSGRSELENIAGIGKMPLSTRHLALVSDSLDPQDLMEKGYMESMVQRAIDLGFDPIEAIQMATLNTAEHFHLDGIVGGIAPGKCADIVVVPHLRSIDAEWVISNGKAIAHRKELLADPVRVRLPGGRLGGIRVVRETFEIPAGGEGSLKVRIIDQVTDAVTREAVVEMVAKGGELRPDPKRDILKVAYLTWGGKVFTGFIRGIGIKAGAIATSYIWQAFGILAVAADEDDMVSAVNRAAELGGGIVLCRHGQFLEELPLPVVGMISDRPLEEVVGGVSLVKEGLRDMGVSFPDALRTLGVLTTPAIPFVRISEEGLVDLRTGRVMPMILR